MKASEIISIYAYSFIVNFFESVALLFVILLVGFVLPAKLWNDQFVAKSVVAEIIIVGSAIRRLRLLNSAEFRDVFVYEQLQWWGWTLLLLMFISFLFGHIKWLKFAVESISARFVVFLYIILPLTVIALFIVIGRFLF